jgi:DinB superfamily
MTMTEPVVPAAVAGAAAALAEEQWRVATLVRAAGVRHRWDAVLDDGARWRLVRSGHFGEYGAELDWTPREVVGHLRDSARIFTDRLRRICTEDVPLLQDFVTDEPARLAEYRRTPVDVLVDDLRAAQAALLATVAGLGPHDLERTGRHETDGPVDVARLLRFLPAHQRDHADQLTALVGR